MIPSAVRDRDLTVEDSEAIVYLESILHDIGHAMKGREYSSSPLTPEGVS